MDESGTAPLSAINPLSEDDVILRHLLDLQPERSAGRKAMKIKGGIRSQTGCKRWVEIRQSTLHSVLFCQSLFLV